MCEIYIKFKSLSEWSYTLLTHTLILTWIYMELSDDYIFNALSVFSL